MTASVFIFLNMYRKHNSLRITTAWTTVDPPMTADLQICQTSLYEDTYLKLFIQLFYCIGGVLLKMPLPEGEWHKQEHVTKKQFLTHAIMMTRCFLKDLSINQSDQSISCLFLQ